MAASPRVFGLGLLLMAAPGVLVPQGQRLGPPWDSVALVLGAPGVENAGTYRYNFPRADLTVRVGDVTVAPAIALGTWAGFGTLGADTVVMGDLVVTSGELAAVLRQLADDDIDVTAVHNHLAGEVPRLMYVHYMARGGALDLATRVRRALRRTAAPVPARRARPAAPTIDTALVFRGLGAPGRASGAVAQLGFALARGPVTMDGRAVPAPIAYGSPVNVQAVSPTRYVATGDFAVEGSKVDRVLDVLARSGVLVTALHSHLIGENPPLYYIHFWADGPPDVVVRGLRAAIDAAR